MPEIAYRYMLDTEGLNWRRVRLLTIDGQVVRFVVQYETMVDGRFIPVVRYDNHHGFCHRDLLNRRGEVVEKSPIDGSAGEVATLAANDIKANWETYLERFMGEAE